MIELSKRYVQQIRHIVKLCSEIHIINHNQQIENMNASGKRLRFRMKLLYLVYYF